MLSRSRAFICLTCYSPINAALLGNRIPSAVALDMVWAWRVWPLEELNGKRSLGVPTGVPCQ